MNFKNCTRIVLLDDDLPCELYEIPTNIKELIINVCDEESQIEEISKVTGLKRLSLSFDLPKDVQKIQKVYNSLKELEWLNTNFIEGITLPSTITYISLVITNHFDLSLYTNLKEIELKCFGDEKKIKLPNKLNKLNIYGKVIVTNLNEIEVLESFFITHYHDNLNGNQRKLLKKGSDVLNSFNVN